MTMMLEERWLVYATARVPKRVELNQSLEPGPAALIESNLAERDISMRGHGPNTLGSCAGSCSRSCRTPALRGMRGQAVRQGGGRAPPLMEE